MTHSAAAEALFRRQRSGGSRRDAIGHVEFIEGMAVVLAIMDGAGPSAFFFQYLGACRRRTPRTCADLKVPKDASGRDLSDATLRFDLAPCVPRRHAPKSC